MSFHEINMSILFCKFSAVHIILVHNDKKGYKEQEPQMLERNRDAIN